VAVGQRQLELAIEQWRDFGDVAELVAALDTYGWLLFMHAADNEPALAAFEKAAALCRDGGDVDGETRSLCGIAQMLVVLGDHDRAEPLALELMSRAGGGTRTQHFGYHFLADCSLLRGDSAQALTRYRDSLRGALRPGDVVETSLEVQGVAMSLVGEQQQREALVLAGAVEALWQSLGVVIDVPFWTDLLERYLGAARRDLGVDGEVAWAVGRSTAFDDAVALALASGDPVEPDGA